MVLKLQKQEFPGASVKNANLYSAPPLTPIPFQQVEGESGPGIFILT